jgi:hypothetical protein
MHVWSCVILITSTFSSKQHRLDPSQSPTACIAPTALASYNCAATFTPSVQILILLGANCFTVLVLQRIRMILVMSQRFPPLRRNIRQDLSRLWKVMVVVGWLIALIRPSISLIITLTSISCKIYQVRHTGNVWHTLIMRGVIITMLPAGMFYWLWL